MKPKQLAFISSIIALTLVLAGLFLPQTLATEQTQEDLKEKATFLLSTFNTSNRSVTQTILNLQTKGIAIPQASLLDFKDAQSLANQSILSSQRGDYSEASMLIIQALQRLKDTITKIYQAVNATDSNQEIDQLIVLKNTIDRNNMLVVRLENIANSAENHGSNVSDARQKIANIKAELDSATQSAKQGNLDQAKNQLRDAETSVAELTEYFDSLAITLQTEKVATYINSSEQRLTTLKQELDSVSNQLSSSDQAAASAALNQAQNSLTQAKQYLTNQQLSQTIDSLTNVNTIEKTVASYINTASPTPTPIVTPKPNISTRNNATNINPTPNVAATT